MAEKTVAAMGVFPFNTVLNVLAPLLQTSQFPSLQGVIKMLTKMVEVHPTEVTDDHLKSIMPGLIKVSARLTAMMYIGHFKRTFFL